MRKEILAVPKAVNNTGFWKAFSYSFGSWLAGWFILWLASAEAYTYLGKYGWIIPLLNTVAVFFKQYFDALQAKTN